MNRNHLLDLLRVALTTLVSNLLEIIKNNIYTK